MRGQRIPTERREAERSLAVLKVASLDEGVGTETMPKLENRSRREVAVALALTAVEVPPAEGDSRRAARLLLLLLLLLALTMIGNRNEVLLTVDRSWRASRLESGGISRPFTAIRFHRLTCGTRRVACVHMTFRHSR